MSVPTRAVIEKGVTIRGELRGEGDLVIEGRVEGRVVSEHGLRVEASGHVDASVEASSVEVLGTIKGDVHAFESVHLHSTALVHGDLHAKKIQMDDGAQLTGQVNMHVDLSERAREVIGV